ncbi:sulfurtransferase [Longirhabdus pacifica]|uniref:sulfurtransferase n=1 Tax=Longirhabdus pacifica TaxID=2305227 RepID=UPI001008D264|nr:sulfurtransferase [Longirhabdus pacifica]
MSAIVSKRWVLARMYEPDVIMVDCRFPLASADRHAGRHQYEQDHIPRAIYLDLEQDLSGEIKKHGGRHPLPSLEQLATKLGKMGINEHVRVVAYDDQGGAMASRLWWLLTYMGHKKVYVMDEGYTKWKEEQYPVSSEPPAVAVPVHFTLDVQQHMLFTAADVKQHLDDPRSLLVDSRERKRYEGKEEPIDKKAGRIPGAKHYFWKELLHEDGRLKSQTELQQHFKSITSEQHKQIVVYCGSGITACPNVLALHEIGIHDVKLYAGSWSDWISYPDNPIEL